MTTAYRSVKCGCGEATFHAFVPGLPADIECCVCRRVASFDPDPRRDRVPGPLAAGPGVSGSTRGASVATEVGSVESSETQGSDDRNKTTTTKR